MTETARRCDRASDASPSIEQADMQAAGAAARHRHHPVVKTLGAFSEIADQTPLSLVCGGITAWGLAADRPRLTATGLQMLAAHVLANVIKRAIKNRVRRTRPNVAIEKRHYHFKTDEGHGGDESSFPSGHTAGAVAVASAMAFTMPKASVPVVIAAGVVAGIQVPRAKHYPLDVAAGAVLGFVSAAAVCALWSRVVGHEDDATGPRRG